MNLNKNVAVKLALSLLLGSAAAVDWADLRTKAVANSLTAAEQQAIVNNWSSHPSDFFKDLTVSGFEAVLAKALGVASVSDWRSDPSSGSTYKGGKFISGISYSDYSEMPVDVCEVVTEFLDYANVSAISSDCRKKYYTKLGDTSVPLRKETIAKIPDSWVKEDTAEIVKAVNARDATHSIALLNINAFKAVMNSDSDVCVNLAAGVLNQLPSANDKSEYRKSVSAACMAKLTGVATADLSKFVAQFPDNVFSLYNDALSEATLKKLTGGQVANFAKKADGNEARCHKLEISHVSGDALAKIEAECYSGVGKNRLGLKISKIPGSVFKALKEFDFVKNINEDDFQYLHADAVQVIFNNSSAIENIPSESVRIHKDIKNITLTKAKELFPEIIRKAPLVAGQMLLNLEELPNDILASCDVDTINRLRAPTGKEGVFLQGDAVLAAMSGTRSNFRDIILLINESYCSSVSESDYMSKEWLRPNLSAKCRKALPFADNVSSLIAKGAFELSDDPSAWKAIIKNFQTSDWRDLSKATAAVLLEKEDFCKALLEEGNKEIFPALSDEALSAINGKCAHTLKSLLTAENVSKLAANALSKFDSAEFKELKVKLNTLPVAQFARLSTEAADAQTSVFAVLTLEEFKELDKDHVAAMASKQWAALPTKVISAGITAESIKTIPSSAMTRITDEQIDAMLEEVLVAINVDQLSQLGLKSKATLRALDKISSKLSKEQNEVLATRKASLKAGDAKVTPDADNSESWPTWYWLVIAGVGILLVGGIVIFFVRK